MSQNKQWRIKQVSDLTNISVRMLRYYEQVGLLAPSVRSSNGYRWYTQQDIAKLQQIIALKYFGFSLVQIKTMFAKKFNLTKSLKLQRQMLLDQVEQLTSIQEVLDHVLLHFSSSKIPDVTDLTNLIERYRMTTELKNTWAKEVLSESQFEQYVEIRQQHPQEFEAWDQVIHQINNNEFGDPEGPNGKKAVETLYSLLEKTKDTFDKQRHLNADIIKDIKSGRISEFQLTPEGNIWLTKAGLAYWLKRW